jgi:hypothetical protein
MPISCFRLRDKVFVIELRYTKDVCLQATACLLVAYVAKVQPHELGGFQMVQILLHLCKACVASSTMGGFITIRPSTVNIVERAAIIDCFLLQFGCPSVFGCLLLCEDPLFWRIILWNLCRSIIYPSPKLSSESLYAVPALLHVYNPYLQHIVKCKGSSLHTKLLITNGQQPLHLPNHFLEDTISGEAALKSPMDIFLSCEQSHS